MYHITNKMVCKAEKGLPKISWEKLQKNTDFLSRVCYNQFNTMGSYDPCEPLKEESTMKRTNLRRRVMSVAMALILLFGAMPAAFASTDGKCDTCGSTYNRNVLKQANCHEYGVVEYICPNAGCAAYNQSILIKTPIDATNHDAVYRDNGDGSTHTATCRYHTDYRNVSELHSFVDGYCTKCAAVDYALAVVSMATSLETYISLNDSQANLSVGEVKVMVGGTDVTDNYTISYSWMDQSGTTVGNGVTYRLPAAVTAKVGDHTYGCFVMAMPKAGTAGKYISASCTVAVHVRDLVLASATVNSDDPDFLLSATNNRTTVSVYNQIYQAAYKLSAAYPAYVIFGAKPVSAIGDLKVNSNAYYFSPAAGQQDLAKVVFDPLGAAAGSYVINFTVYDTAGKDFPGVLTVIVEKDLGTLDVSYTTTPGVPVRLNSQDFSAFWQKTHTNGTMNLIYFKTLPSAREGVLYYNYNYGNTSVTNTAVTVEDMFYLVPTNANQKIIDGLTFVPDTKFTGFVTIPFEQYGMTNRGQYALLSGNLSIFVSAGSIQDVTYSITSGSTLNLTAADFQSAHQLATGTASTNFSIKLLDVPQNGALDVDYTATALDKPLTLANVSDYTFYYSNPLSKEINDLTYICPESTTDRIDTIRYVACDSKGEFEYVGKIVITNKASVVIYTKFFTDVNKTDWFYTYVMDLAEDDVINGMTETTFEPKTEVTYGQALKLIMLAAGYNVPTKTGTHWASGYLTMAQADGLVSTALTESYLDRKIAAKALRLPASTITTSPFSDVVVGTTYASYIFSLYDAGIVEGTKLSDGTVRYYGVNSITRAEMSAIVWRINNYKKA